VNNVLVASCFGKVRNLNFISAKLIGQISAESISYELCVLTQPVIAGWVNKERPGQISHLDLTLPHRVSKALFFNAVLAFAHRL
jgi:hypothetical protein